VKDGCAGHANYFVTLTFREYPNQMEADRYDFAQKRWHSLLRLCAKEGVRFAYIRVVELQKRGTPHFHLVVNRITVGGQKLVNTAQIEMVFRRLALRSGFGPQLKVEKARHGGAGAASYLSKYLSKSEVWEMVRPDGRAIRRYSQSQGWCLNERRKVWRFRAVGEISDTELYRPELTCGCGDGFVLRASQQAAKWVANCISADTWCAPMGLFDSLLSQYEQN